MGKIWKMLKQQTASALLSKMASTASSPEQQGLGCRGLRVQGPGGFWGLGAQGTADKDHKLPARDVEGARQTVRHYLGPEVPMVWG